MPQHWMCITLHCATLLLCYCAAVPLCYCAIVLLCYCTIVLVCHCAIVLLCYCATVPLCFCATVPLCYCATVPLCQCSGLQSWVVKHDAASRAIWCPKISDEWCAFILKCLTVASSIILLGSLHPSRGWKSRQYIPRNVWHKLPTDAAT